VIDIASREKRKLRHLLDGAASMLDLMAARFVAGRSRAGDYDRLRAVMAARAASVPQLSPVSISPVKELEQLILRKRNELKGLQSAVLEYLVDQIPPKGMYIPPYKLDVKIPAVIADAVARKAWSGGYSTEQTFYATVGRDTERHLDETLSWNESSMAPGDLELYRTYLTAFREYAFAQELKARIRWSERMGEH
jgi:hypothetical protein